MANGMIYFLLDAFIGFNFLFAADTDTSLIEHNAHPPTLSLDRGYA